MKTGPGTAILAAANVPPPPPIPLLSRRPWLSSFVLPREEMETKSTSMIATWQDWKRNRAAQKKILSTAQKIHDRNVLHQTIESKERQLEFSGHFPMHIAK